jgi:hypothetical protein
LLVQSFGYTSSLPRNRLRNNAIFLSVEEWVVIDAAGEEKDAL